MAVPDCVLCERAQALGASDEILQEWQRSDASIIWMAVIPPAGARELSIRHMELMIKTTGISANALYTALYTCTALFDRYVRARTTSLLDLPFICAAISRLVSKDETVTKRDGAKTIADQARELSRYLWSTGQIAQMQSMTPKELNQWELKVWSACGTQIHVPTIWTCKQAMCARLCVSAAATLGETLSSLGAMDFHLMRLVLLKQSVDPSLTPYSAACGLLTLELICMSWLDPQPLRTEPEVSEWWETAFARWTRGILPTGGKGTMEQLQYATGRSRTAVHQDCVRVAIVVTKAFAHIIDPYSRAPGESQCRTL